ncbi:hypothetical protein OKA06_00070 [Novosphingobium sp. MW5]|nr:hypothetical protein [Novosphingobium sp. MW5]
MFDPAASLMKSMGLAMPAESAGSVIPAVPGEGVEAAGNGGFANLLAIKLETAAPNLTIDAAMQPAPQPAAETSAPALLAPAATDLPAKALPATGKMLPLDLPVALPVAPTAPAPRLATPAIALALPTPEPVTAAKPVPLEAVQVHAKAATPIQDPAAPAEAVRAEPALAPLAARAAALPAQPADDAAMAPEAEAATEPQPAHAPLPVQTVPVKTRPAVRAAEARPADQPEHADDQPELSQPEEPKAEQRQPFPVLTNANPLVPVSPAPVETTPGELPRSAPRARAAAPLSAVAATTREAGPEGPRADLAQLAPTVQQPQPQVPQATIRIAAAPADARREGEPVTVAARAGEAEPASETAPATAAPRTAQPFAMLSPAMPAQAPLTLSAMPASAVQAPADFAQIVDRLVAAREAVAPSEVRVTIDHAQFGKVSVGFTPDSSGMSVTLAAADPEFARAVEAAAPFAPPSVTTETQPIPAPAAARGADLTSAFTGQQGQQASRQAPQDTRPSGPQSQPFRPHL